MLAISQGAPDMLAWIEGACDWKLYRQCGFDYPLLRIRIGNSSPPSTSGSGYHGLTGPVRRGDGVVGCRRGVVVAPFGVAPRALPCAWPRYRPEGLGRFGREATARAPAGGSRTWFGAPRPRSERLLSDYAYGCFGSQCKALPSGQRRICVPSTDNLPQPSARRGSSSS